MADILERICDHTLLKDGVNEGKSRGLSSLNSDDSFFDSLLVAAYGCILTLFSWPNR